jgi:hypothetical protein
MTLRKILLAASTGAMLSMPAWALPSQTLADHGPSSTPAGPPQQTPNDNENPGKGHHGKGGDNPSGSNGSQGNSGSDNGGNGGSRHHHPSHPGNSNMCVAHEVAYVASGTLLSWTLTKDSSASTYSGELEVEVTKTNHHALADAGKTVKYKVSGVNVNFVVADTDKDGTVEPDDLVKGDRTRLIGKITRLAKKCSQTGFIAVTTIERINFHEPRAMGGNH